MPIDLRRLRVGIEIRGQLRFYDDLAITVSGQKYASPTQSDCTVTIANLNKENRDYILTETSPFNRDPSRKSIVVEAGRDSYGTSVVYRGDIFRSSVSQAPDNVLTLRCTTNQFNKGRLSSISGTANESLRSLSQRVADANDLELRFESPDKNIGSYTFSGSAADQIRELSLAANSDVYVDDSALVVKEFDQPLQGGRLQISAQSGMIGIPELTEQGVKVTFFYTPAARLGSGMDLISDQYPALTGAYVIYRLKFHLTNRDTPFYYTAEARRV